MVTPPRSQPGLRPFLPLSSALPCDVHLLNLRTLQEPQEARDWPEEAALLLHRKGFDCSAPPDPPPPCTLSPDEQVDLDGLFSPLVFRSVRRSGLTLLRDHDRPAAGSPRRAPRTAALRPMEVAAFRVQMG